MDQINCFRTTDGQLFEGKSDALKHQTRLDFIEWYQRNQLYGMRGAVDFKDLGDWLGENASKPIFRSYLNVIRDGSVKLSAWDPLLFDLLIEECHHYIGNSEDIGNGGVRYWLEPGQLKQFAEDAVLFYFKHRSQIDPNFAKRQCLPIFR
jgi:hypothetical protein